MVEPMPSHSVRRRGGIEHLLVGGADGFLGAISSRVRPFSGAARYSQTRLDGDGAADFAAVVPAHAVGQDGGAERGAARRKASSLFGAVTAGVSRAVGAHHGCGLREPADDAVTRRMLSQRGRLLQLRL